MPDRTSPTPASAAGPRRALILSGAPAAGKSLALVADMPASPHSEPVGGVSAPADVAAAQDRRQRSSETMQRPIPIRTIPRAALDALVARLQARGLRHVGTAEGSPHD